MYRKTRRTKTMTIAAIAALAFTFQAIQVSATNLSTAYASSVGTISAASPTSVVNQFEALLKQNQISKAFTYLKAHIVEVNKSQATLMVLHLENAVKKQLPALQKRFEALSVQKGIGKAYKKGDSFDNVISRTTDKTLKGMLMSARDSGYKLETAEGFFFPVVNYTGFKIFADRVNSDISTYIDIMSVETEQAPLKDAALVIGYQQLVNRALSQEKFLSLYPHSNRANHIGNLLLSYRTLTYYGANNTPLFGYDYKLMNANAQKAYKAMLQRNDPKSSAYLNLLQQFMDVVEKNNYKLNAEVEKFRKDKVPNN
ncbi:hypothetical protein [Cohnella herbarum]|uniref:Uncharacterized protein n=1 Tax=Cohnella herbarum TaxID=2728023 RepID=A0A7Z2VH97_9BACL|nr:hypothetical protein [Cohnella herbarum]QJD82859.1 hypothetical protein HH215_06470 [Cohnella herbarum]